LNRNWISYIFFNPNIGRRFLGDTDVDISFALIADRTNCDDSNGGRGIKAQTEICEPEISHSGRFYVKRELGDKPNSP